MKRISPDIIIKILSRQLERLERMKNGGTIAYAEGEREYIIKALKQVKDDYKQYKLVGKPVFQSDLAFIESIKQQPPLISE
jgi:hypothetical protein